MLSFFKFNHCQNNDWASPDNYVHACYTDIPALFTERGLDTNTFPYQSATNSMEYPPLTGLTAWLISFVTPDNSHNWFFNLNALLLIMMFIISAVIVKHLAPKYLYLFPASPAVVASLFINWDLLAVACALLAIYYFENKKFELSGIWLGISIATKFFPIVLLLPIAVIFYRRRQYREFIRYFFTTTIIWLAVNLPIALFYFDGWWRFIKLNLERGADYELDHKFSITEGFKQNVSPEIIGHYANLELLPKFDNRSKRIRCSIALTELNELITTAEQIQ